MCWMVEVERCVVVGVGGAGAGGAGERGVAPPRMRAATSRRSVEPSSTPVPNQRLHGNLQAHKVNIIQLKHFKGVPAE